eukprot:gene1802-biopygen18397
MWTGQVVLPDRLSTFVHTTGLAKWIPGIWPTVRSDTTCSTTTFGRCDERVAIWAVCGLKHLLVDATRPLYGGARRYGGIAQQKGTSKGNCPRFGELPTSKCLLPRPDGTLVAPLESRKFEILMDFDACWTPSSLPAPRHPQGPWDRQFSPSARFRLLMEGTDIGS